MNNLRLLVLLALSVVALCGASSGAEAATDIRGFVWGVTKEEVRRFEKATFYKEEGDSLFFLEQPDYFRRMVRYDFREGKLFRMRYEYLEFFMPEANDVIGRYIDLKHSLEEKYKTPAKDEMVWKDKTYLRFPQYWPRAFMRRDLAFRSVWEFPDTRIVMETYHEDAPYKLYYEAEQVSARSKDVERNILDLPAAQ